MPPRRRSRTPSSRPPSKRARHSSSASADPGPCSLLDLPIELLSDIVKRLRRKELRLLSQTCKAFYEAYRHQVVMKYAAEDCLAIRLWCLSDAEEGEFGWSPFVIDLVHQKYEHKASRGAPAELIVATFTPEFERFEEDELTSDYMHVELTNGYVEMEGEYWGTQAYLNDVGGATVRYLDWDRDIRGRLVRATPELLYSRFTCPECEGTKYERLVPPKHLKHRRVDLPCPRCTWPEVNIAKELRKFEPPPGIFRPRLGLAYGGY